MIRNWCNQILPVIHNTKREKSYMKQTHKYVDNMKWKQNKQHFPR